MQTRPAFEEIVKENREQPSADVGGNRQFPAAVGGQSERALRHIKSLDRASAQAHGELKEGEVIRLKEVVHLRELDYSHCRREKLTVCQRAALREIGAPQSRLPLLMDEPFDTKNPRGIDRNYAGITW